LGGSEEAFKKMQNAYEFLLALHGKALGVFREEEINGNSKKTVDGIPLVELGQGLGPTTNGKNCPTCEHRGYTIEYGRSWSVCEECDELGRVSREFPCRACRGTGKFTQRRTRRVVDCRACNGTGVFRHPLLMMRCPKCLGTKTVWGKDENGPIYRVCWECRGKGEILIWNPVFPKGRLG